MGEKFSVHFTPCFLLLLLLFLTRNILGHIIWVTDVTLKNLLSGENENLKMLKTVTITKKNNITQYCPPPQKSSLQLRFKGALSLLIPCLGSLSSKVLTKWGMNLLESVSMIKHAYSLGQDLFFFSTFPVWQEWQTKRVWKPSWKKKQSLKPEDISQSGGFKIQML